MALEFRLDVIRAAANRSSRMQRLRSNSARCGRYAKPLGIERLYGPGCVLCAATISHLKSGQMQTSYTIITRNWPNLRHSTRSLQRSILWTARQIVRLWVWLELRRMEAAREHAVWNRLSHDVAQTSSARGVNPATSPWAVGLLCSTGVLSGRAGMPTPRAQQTPRRLRSLSAQNGASVPCSIFQSDLRCGSVEDAMESS